MGALKFIGFLDASGAPTEKYKNYKGKDGPRILADSIETSYSELFQLYPDANQKDEESLNHFFATKTSVGESSRKAMIGTFKAFCSIADFEAPLPRPDEKTERAVEEMPKEISSSRVHSTPPININIELQIPATNDLEVYKNFFEAMKKYLLTD